MTARHLPLIAMLALLPLSHVWAAEGDQHLKCDIAVSGQAAPTRYITLHKVDLGSYWSWQADDDCATFLLDGPRSAMQAPTMFPKVLGDKPDWKNEQVITFTGKNGYDAGPAQMRFHAMPQGLVPPGQDMRFDIKVRQELASKQGSIQFVEQSSIAYTPATGEIQRASGRVKDATRNWNIFTLVNCNQAGANCPASATPAPAAADADVKVIPLQ
ncbi:hypothetical protein [Silvimonas sp.]|uniref:hypothetical protein n=1 Tax=Silvimonas sp. TaxID=2650811 RepID=UPI00284B1FB3|nr:hypothetical protein [Silvimonas sp.]MDR3427263.1 hypothetical protein [Silvimonas sp.]